MTHFHIPEIPAEAWFPIAAVGGGIAKYVDDVRTGKRKFMFWKLIASALVCGFVGVMLGIMVLGATENLLLAFGATSYGGWAGPKSVDLIETIIRRKLGSK